MTEVTTYRDLDRKVSASKAGLITTGLTLINVVLGFGFQSIVAARLGLSQTSDDFQLAWSLVTFGTVVFFTLVPILLVPRLEDPLSRTISLGDWPKFVTLGVILCVAQLLYAAFCEPGLAEILRWSSLSHLFASMTALPQAAAYLRRRFVAAGIGPAVNGAALLSAFLWIGEGDHPAGLGLALTIGYVFQFSVVTFLSMRKSGPYSTRSEIPVRLFLFLLAFTLLSKFQPLLERILSVTGPVGATATLGFGQKIAQGLLLFAAFGLALTANATLARRIRGGQLDGAAELLAKTIVTTVLFSSAVVMMILPVQRLLIEILFVRGQFSSSDAQAVSDVLVCQIPWVLACAVTGSLTSYLYIERSYARVAVAALVGLAVTFLASYLLQPVIPLTAVPIASSAGASMTLGWVFYLVVKSPVWPNLKVRLGSYLPLMTVSCSAMGLSYTLEGIAHLMSLSDYLLADLLMGAMFAVFVLLIRFSKSLRTQCRTAMGGQL